MSPMNGLSTAIFTATLFVTSAAVHARTDPQSCDIDREKLLRLNQLEFDQDLKGGWRTLAAKPGCELAAADLLRDYRQAHGSDDSILYWHEGQLRAEAGQTEQAAALMVHSRHSTDDKFAWNEYVDATVAFLRKDRATFDVALQKLAATPPVEGVKDGYLETKMANGSVRKIRWPMNIDVVEGLARCFDKPYREAYGGVCRSPAK